MASLTPAAVMALTATVVALGVIGIAMGLGHERVARPVFGGMLGPLIAAVATWIVTVRTYRRNPAEVAGLMMRAFLVKVLFFAAYVVVMVKVAELPVRLFGLSFTAFFIGLYAAEAVLIARLSRQSFSGSR
ncbi:MAG TPA: hypothetical protein VN700_08315 [Vicinamibacterales bacterium]|nr:hypothetical protein [Vicinamibacterales bacterium]